jgi:two-component system chemotaxis sensor kinase CheA
MSSKEEEYKEMFLSEALENYEQLNELFIILEKDVNDTDAIDSIFRITHTLKGNSMGMGFEEIAGLSHVMEDMFSEVKEGDLKLTKPIFDGLFKANDKLGALIDALKTGKKVSYKGIVAKLKVILRKSREHSVNKDSGSEITAKESSETVVELTEVKSNQEEIQSVEDEEERAEPNFDTVINEDEEAAITVEEDDEAQAKIAFSDLVQVPIRKLDALMNQVGQLIIERDRLIAISDFSSNGRSTSDFTRLQRITSDLQYSVMDVRLVQIGFLFNKFHRIVRDVASIESKDVNLVLKGTDIEIDRNILKIMSDSLVHLVRNAVSHGIEDANLRKQREKAAAGTITLNARNEKDNVIIEVCDDGNGIDTEIIRKKIVDKGLLNQEMATSLSKGEVLLYIFEPGFSNADQITEVSGRGVGMDVVKRAAETIGGQIAIETEVGIGSMVRLTLPSSMAVKGALLFMLGQQEFAFALSYTEAVISLYKKDIHKINNGLMAKYLDNTISIIFLEDLLKMSNLNEIANEGVFHNTYHRVFEDTKLDVIVVSHSGRFVGIVVDKLLQQKEIVENTLSRPLDNVKLLTGTTILGNGNVCLVVDVAVIAELLFKSVQKSNMVELV